MWLCESSYPTVKLCRGGNTDSDATPPKLRSRPLRRHEVDVMPARSRPCFGQLSKPCQTGLVSSEFRLTYHPCFSVKRIWQQRHALGFEVTPTTTSQVLGHATGPLVRIFSLRFPEVMDIKWNVNPLFTAPRDGNPNSDCPLVSFGNSFVDLRVENVSTHCRITCNLKSPLGIISKSSYLGECWKVSYSWFGKQIESRPISIKIEFITMKQHFVEDQFTPSIVNFCESKPFWNFENWRSKPSNLFRVWVAPYHFAVTCWALVAWAFFSLF